MRQIGLDAGRDGGYRHVLQVAFPLIVSNASTTVMLFVDRIFLARYSGEALSGAAVAGLGGFTCMSLFVGTAAYTSAFVAQYFGAGRYERIPAALWHGLYFALMSAAVLAVGSVFAGEITRLTGHEPEVLAEETVYFRIFILGAGLPVVNVALSTFYSGLGKTYYNMFVQAGGSALNVLLNYVLIFGKLGFPRWGTKGAAVATVVSWGVICVSYVCLLRFGKLGRRYGMLRKPRFDRELFGRLLRYGIPQGLQWTVEMVGWCFFVVFVGRLGKIELQAVMIAFSINHLAFLPMIGFGIATSVLVGQFIGSGRALLAQRATRSALLMTLAYMGLVALIFVFVPQPFVRLFRQGDGQADFQAVYPLTIIFLRFVAVYCIFDAVNIVYSGALKGAGDTRYVMYMIALLSFACLVLPVVLAIQVFKMGFYAAAVIATGYVGVMALAFYLRYRGGRWKSMRVIEAAAPADAPAVGGPSDE